MSFLVSLCELIKETYSEWTEDEAPMVAAALAYYTAFSMAPLIIIVVAIAGTVANQDSVKAQILEQIDTTIGSDTAELVDDLIEKTSKPKTSVWSSILGMGALLIGALGVFNHLQTALDRMWDVDHVSHKGGIRGFLEDKLLSFGMILVVGFLLLVSLMLSVALSFLDDYLAKSLHGAGLFLHLLSWVFFLGITTLLFMSIYKFLPHTYIRWQDVSVGAAVTAILFSFGKTALGFYLGNSATASAYGAAGSFALILLWVYYSAQILLFGAEFTQVYAKRYGSHLEA